MRNGSKPAPVVGSGSARVLLRGAAAPSDNLNIALESVNTLYSIDAVGSPANSAGPAEFQGLQAVTQVGAFDDGEGRGRHRASRSFDDAGAPPHTLCSTAAQADLDAFAKNDGVANWKIGQTVRRTQRSDTCTRAALRKHMSTCQPLPSQIGPFSGSNTESVLDEEFIAGVGAGNTQWFWTELE